jgi:hypothetical protein
LVEHAAEQAAQDAQTIANQQALLHSKE